MKDTSINYQSGEIKRKEEEPPTYCVSVRLHLPSFFADPCSALVLPSCLLSLPVRLGDRRKFILLFFTSCTTGLTGT